MSASQLRYECSYCSLAFNQKTALKRHEISVHSVHSSAIRVHKTARSLRPKPAVAATGSGAYATCKQAGGSGDTGATDGPSNKRRKVGTAHIIQQPEGLETRHEVSMLWLSISVGLTRYFSLWLFCQKMNSLKIWSNGLAFTHFESLADLG